jgi:alpha-tubulin suppressor-like RCC1 family protein
MKKLLAFTLSFFMMLIPVIGGAKRVENEPCDTVELSHEWAQFSMGDTHSAAIQPEGLGYAWGYNYDGAIGNGITASSNTTTPYNWGSNIRAVYANRKTTLSIDNNDVLYLCGERWYGIGGSSDMLVPYYHTTPTQFATNVRSASMGFNHLVYVKNDNTLWVYGENSHGQIGDNTTNNCYTAKQILTNVSYAVAGDCITAAVKTDGTLWVWGYNGSGQVGNGSTSDKYTPVQVLTNVFTVSVMGDHVMAIKNDGSLWAWGLNSYGQLGTGNTSNVTSPVQVMTGVAQVSAGMYHTGVIKSDGTLWFAGNNFRGQFGNGSTASTNTRFTQTEGCYLAVNCGTNTTAVLSTEGQLYVAGWNTYGQLGNGTTGASFPTLSPIDVWIFNGVDPLPLLGDVNCDGVVDFCDVTTLYAFLMNCALLSNQGLINANMNQDSRVDMNDVSAIYMYILS